MGLNWVLFAVCIYLFLMWLCFYSPFSCLVSVLFWSQFSFWFILFHILSSCRRQFPCLALSSTLTCSLSVCNSCSPLLISSPQCTCSCHCLSLCQILALTLYIDHICSSVARLSIFFFPLSGLLCYLIYCFPSLVCCAFAFFSYVLRKPLDCCVGWLQLKRSCLSIDRSVVQFPALRATCWSILGQGTEPHVFYRCVHWCMNV